jgi:hypothetical protein
MEDEGVSIMGKIKDLYLMHGIENIDEDDD